MHKVPRVPLINDFYHQYLIDQKTTTFIRSVSKHYTLGTLERLAHHSARVTRRAAVLAVGLIGGYESNATLGRALCDMDRGVRMIADSNIRLLWTRWGTSSQRRRLNAIVRMNAAQRHHEAVRLATQLIAAVEELPETWHQRAVAHFNLGNFELAIDDCRQALERNPYHFVAAATIGQAQLRLGDRRAALDSFRWAMRLNPGLETARVQVQHLERTLNNPQ
ncbi:MAG TPA: tetratricopeptide repeat protein [Pirellulales bacterium]|nr:tetratricopeptide repeat protein [Pirellulales bacterium]